MKESPEIPPDDHPKDASKAIPTEALTKLAALEDEVERLRAQSIKLTEQLTGLLQEAKEQNEGRKRATSAYLRLFDGAADLANTLLESMDGVDAVPNQRLLPAVRSFAQTMKEAVRLMGGKDNEE